MNEHISDERVIDILDKYAKDWENIHKLSSVICCLPMVELEELAQEDRQKLVEAYNLYRAAPYDWYYSVE